MAYLIRCKMTVREKHICRELAYLHLEGLHADITKPAVHEVVEMIYESWTFREIMEKILETPIEKIIESLPNDRAGTRAKSFLKDRDIRDVEGLVRLSEADVRNAYGFGPETATALRRALEKNDLRFEMLSPRPLSASPAEKNGAAPEQRTAEQLR